MGVALASTTTTSKYQHHLFCNLIRIDEIISKQLTTRMLRVILFGLHLGLLSRSAEAQTYAVMAPTVVRPNSDYLVAVSVFGLSEDQSQDVQLTLKGRSSNTGQSIEIRGETNVRSASTEIVRLRIGDIGEGKVNSKLPFRKFALEYVYEKCTNLGHFSRVLQSNSQRKFPIDL